MKKYSKVLILILFLLTSNVGFVNATSDDNATCCKYITNGKTGYKWINSNATCANPVDSSYCKDIPNNTATAEDTKGCYANSSESLFEYVEKSKARNGWHLVNYDEATCNTFIKNIADDAATKAEQSAGNQVIVGADTTDGSKNTCKSYTVKRVREYNNSLYSGISRGNNKYFYSPVSVSFSDPYTSNRANQYYVYQTTSNCNDDNKNVPAFCIDPGAEGASISGTKYRPSTDSIIDKNTKFGRGMTKLYIYWYVEKKDEIMADYNGSAEGKEDYLNYIMNTISRLLVINYGKEAGISNIWAKKTWGNDEKKAWQKGKLVKSSGMNETSWNRLNTVWNDVKKTAEGSGDVVSKEDLDNEVQLYLEQDSVSMTQSSVTASFTITIKADKKSILDDILNNKKYSLSLSDEKDNAIALDVSDYSIGEWKRVSDTSANVKIDLKKADLGVVTDSVNINFSITAKSEKSLKNIILLQSVTSVSPKYKQPYQQFITFLNGTLGRTASLKVNYDIKKEKTSCTPLYYTDCKSTASVYHLVEGTQSPEIYNQIMSSIKSIDELNTFVNDVKSAIDQLKNFSLSLNDLKLVGGLTKNVSEKTSSIGQLMVELKNILNRVNVNNNKLAANLKNSISDAVERGNYLTLLSYITGSISDTISNGVDYDELLKEYNEILDAAKVAKEAGQVTDSTYEFLTNIKNMLSAGKSLGGIKNIIGAATTLGNYLVNNKGLDSEGIKGFSQVFTTFTSNLVTKAQDGMSGIVNSFNDIASKITNVVNNGGKLTDVSNIFSTLTSSISVDWEKCIIGDNTNEPTDPNGNSYTVQSENSYCKVVCKEDYAIKTPGKLGTVYAGQNISVNLDNVYHATVGMAGQRTCVTTSIDNQKYVDAAVAKKEEIKNKYNEFKKNYGKYKAAQLTNISDPRKPEIQESIADISGARGELESIVKGVVEAGIKPFIQKLVPNDLDKQYTYLSNFKSSDLITILVNCLTAGGTDSITDEVLGAMLDNDSEAKKLKDNNKDTYEEAKKAFVSGIQSEIKNKAGDIAKSLVTKVGGEALLFGLQTLCNISQNAQGLPELIGAIFKVLAGACQGWTYASEAITTTVNTLSKDENLKILWIEDGGDFEYDYQVHSYKTDTENTTLSEKEKLLKAQLDVDNSTNVHVNKGEDKSANFKSNAIWIPTLKNNGAYTAGSVKFGATFNFDQIQVAVNSFNNFVSYSGKAYENIANGLKTVEADLKELGSVFGDTEDLKNGKGALKGFTFDENQKASLLAAANRISSLINSVSTLINSMDKLQANASVLTDYLIDFVYDFMGIFNNKYYTISQIRHTMEQNKVDYNNLVEQLEDMASNMSDCTTWNNQYKFNPNITFSYNYTGTYFSNKKDSRTNEIKLSPINQGDIEEVYYYCDSDVDINDAQKLSTILSGKCITSDDLIGGIITSLLGNNSEYAGILKNLTGNVKAIKSLLSNTKNKDILNNFDVSNVTSFITNILGVNTDDNTDANDDTVLTTNVPGRISYTLINGGTSIGSVGNAIKTDGLNGLIVELSKNLKYTLINENNIKYRNVGRVIKISRAGNPGIAISGIHAQSLVSNALAFLGGNSEILSKISDILEKTTGLQLIYYKSSQSYWTTSNKGIYTTAPTSSDSVYIDNGDAALTNPDIVSGNGSEKKADGTSYPLPLDTKVGTYIYKIKINNVGEYYNNNFSLGRIMDDSGYISGTFANQYVCKYDVKTTPDDGDETCKTILESDVCKDSNGYFREQYIKNINYAQTNGIEEKFNACVTALLDKNCCNEVGNKVPSASEERYNQVCSDHCSGVTFYNAITNGGTLNNTDNNNANSALITKNGTLNFVTKVVSNNNMFPNGDTSKSFNYKGTTSGYENKDENGKPQPQEISKIIEQWEEKGDSIYDADADFSIDLNAACIAKIKSYNDEQEKIDLGFGDYTLGSISKESREYKSKFLQDLRENPGTCVIKEKTTN